MKITYRRNLVGQFRHQSIGERFKNAMTRRRYAGNMPKVKKTILILFLIFVNIYILGNLAIDLAPYITAEAATSKIYNENARPDGGDVHSQTGTAIDAPLNVATGVLVAPSQGVEAKIRTAWAGTGEEDNAVKIAMCESGLDPTRIGDRHLAIEGTKGMSFGLFQIRHLDGRPDPEWLLHEDNNIQYARELWEKSGWTPWTCARKI